MWVTNCCCRLDGSPKVLDKHRKVADFDPHGAQTSLLILMKLGRVDYVQDPTPHDNCGMVMHCWWSGQICDLSILRTYYVYMHKQRK